MPERGRVSKLEREAGNLGFPSGQFLQRPDGSRGWIKFDKYLDLRLAGYIEEEPEEGGLSREKTSRGYSIIESTFHSRSLFSGDSCSLEISRNFMISPAIFWKVATLGWREKDSYQEKRPSGCWENLGGQDGIRPAGQSRTVLPHTCIKINVLHLYENKMKATLEIFCGWIFSHMSQHLQFELDQAKTGLSHSI